MVGYCFVKAVQAPRHVQKFFLRFCRVGLFCEFHRYVPVTAARYPGLPYQFFVSVCHPVSLKNRPYPHGRGGMVQIKLELHWYVLIGVGASHTPAFLRQRIRRVFRRLCVGGFNPGYNRCFLSRIVSAGLCNGVPCASPRCRLCLYSASRTL